MSAALRVNLSPQPPLCAFPFSSICGSLTFPISVSNLDLPAKSPFDLSPGRLRIRSPFSRFSYPTGHFASSVVVLSYNNRFSMNLSEREIEDLTNLLNAQQSSPVHGFPLRRRVFCCTSANIFLHTRIPMCTLNCHVGFSTGAVKNTPG